MREFLFRKRFYQQIKGVKAPAARLPLYDGIILFGVVGEKIKLNGFPIQNQEISEIYDSIVSEIDEDEKYFQESLEQGRKGRRRRNRENGDFIFRQSFYQSLKWVSDPDLKIALYDRIIGFGIFGNDYLSKNPCSNEVCILSQEIISQIDRTNRRYRRYVDNGRKGGLIGGKIAGRGRKR